MSNISRRKFIQSLALASTTVFIEPGDLFAAKRSGNGLPDEKLVFLFQGDSITDGNRGRNTDPNHIMGHGYAFSVASRIAADFPEKDFTFHNRGISGNQVADLQKRWEEDSILLNPDVLNVLIGVNDVGVIINKPELASSLEEFENNYRDILQRSKSSNSNIIFVLGLPFAYPIGKLRNNWVTWSTELGKRVEVIKKLAREFDAILVDYPAVFTKAFKRKSQEYWIWDGVHPTIAGHELMAREWIKQVSHKLMFLRKYKY